MIFNNNRLFSVDLKKQQGTSASEEDREFQSPDFDVWKNLSLEMAWKQHRRRAGQQAAVLRRVELHQRGAHQGLVVLRLHDAPRPGDAAHDGPDRAGAAEACAVKQPAEFEKAFTRSTRLTLAQLDKEWEDFWTGASPVLKAIQNNTPPLSAISKGVDKWLEAYNAARKALRPYTGHLVSANFSAPLQGARGVPEEEQGPAGPADLHTQSVDLGGSYIGSLFAQMALVQTGANLANAKKIFERWIYWPGYRDALLNPLDPVGRHVPRRRRAGDQRHQRHRRAEARQRRLRLLPAAQRPAADPRR
jgi:hypothetical protein